MAGYRLGWGAIGCAMACGPSVGDGDGSADGESGGSGSGMSLSASGDASASDDASTGAQTTSTDTLDTGVGSSSDDAGSSSSDDGPPTGCFEGDICGEFSVCACSCDYDPRCCACETVECTMHAHCDEGASCVDLGPYDTFHCLPVADCDSLLNAYIETQATLADFAGTTCLQLLEAEDASLVDLAGLQSLAYVHQSVEITADATLVSLAGLESLAHAGRLVLDGNAALNDIGALAGLESLTDGGQITNNPSLPAADVHALLAGIEGGDEVQVCGNLDDVPC
jgi:hypothetical protein